MKRQIQNNLQISQLERFNLYFEYNKTLGQVKDDLQSRRLN